MNLLFLPNGVPPKWFTSLVSKLCKQGTLTSFSRLLMQQATRVKQNKLGVGDGPRMDLGTEQRLE